MLSYIQKHVTWVTVTWTVDVWWNIGGQNQWVTKSRCFHDYWWRHRFSWVEMFWTRGTTWAQILLLNEINKIRKCILWIDVVVCKIQAILHACQPFLGIHVHMAPLALDSLSTKTVLELRISFSVYAWYLLSAEESDITNTVCTFKNNNLFDDSLLWYRLQPRKLRRFFHGWSVARGEIVITETPISTPCKSEQSWADWLVDHMITVA